MAIIPRLPPARSLDVGLDFWRATATYREDWQTLAAIGQSVVAQDSARGMRVRPYSWYGYKGERSRYAFWGVCGRGACVEAAGSLADETFDALDGLDLALTRVDHAVTCLLPEEEQDVVEVVRDAYVAAIPLLPRAPEWDYQVSSWGGATFYLGRRASDYFGRIYDKTRQSRGAYPEGAWRWELEVKKPSSVGHGRALLASADRRAQSSATVRAWFARHGVPCPWDGLAGDVLPRPRHEAADYERWGLWAERCVRPSLRKWGNAGRDTLIRWLLEDFGEGEAA